MAERKAARYMQKYTPAQIRKVLSSCTGTLTYYKYYRYFFTDGVKMMAEMCEAFWLIDLIISWQANPKILKEPFQVWELSMDEGKNSGVVIATNGYSVELAKQEIPYTNFPLKEGIKVWKLDEVILLPSEY